MTARSERFRANGGRVGNPSECMALSTHHLGAKRIGSVLSPLVGPMPPYARTRIMPLIRDRMSASERTTGFEPATLTLAKWGEVLIVSSTWL